MKRRRLLQGMALLGLGLPCCLFGYAHAASMPLRRATTDLELIPLPRERVPQVISVFLYGGASELAANLSHMETIMANSELAYPENLAPDHALTQVTKSNFWRDAGGEIMERLLARGQMNIYRTMARRDEGNKAHGPAVLENLAGVAEVSAAGMAARLALVAAANNPFDVDPEQWFLPFVSLEGEAPVFRPGGLDMPAYLTPVSLDGGGRNPYERAPNPLLNSAPQLDQALDRLALEQSATGRWRGRVAEIFRFRQVLAERLFELWGDNRVEREIDALNALAAADERIDYGETEAGQRMKLAVSLALANPQSLFISVGGLGLGSWDDHSQALAPYRLRMSQLMVALEAAARHLNLARGAYPNAGNIIINVFGDFGRNLNLNRAAGWDHGNNQNFFTLGGDNLRPPLGRIIGRTAYEGGKGAGRQFLVPAADSYRCEPFAVAASLYAYFGVRNPGQLTGGVAPVDENQPGEN